jgi:hypothetical protein
MRTLRKRRALVQQKRCFPEMLLGEGIKGASGMARNRPCGTRRKRFSDRVVPHSGKGLLQALSTCGPKLTAIPPTPKVRSRSPGAPYPRPTSLSPSSTAATSPRPQPRRPGGASPSCWCFVVHGLLPRCPVSSRSPPALLGRLRPCCGRISWACMNVSSSITAGCSRCGPPGHLRATTQDRRDWSRSI